MAIRKLVFILFAVFAIVPTAHSLRFVTFGSSQGDLPSPLPPKVFTSLVKQMALIRPKPQFWVFLGNAFYGYTADSTDLPNRWNSWKLKTDAISYIPGYLAMGNQEANITGKIDGAPFFRAAWPELPRNGPPGLQGTVYSFDAGDCHFIVLNTEVYNDFSRVGWDQRAWLEEDLKKTQGLHRFVFGHEEAYPPIVRKQRSLEDNPGARDSLWDILYRNGVEAYVCGHLHTYNRNLFDRILPKNVSEVKQVVCGTSGAAFDEWAGTPFYHYLVWDVEGPRVKITAYDQTGGVQDSFFLFPRTQGRSVKATTSYPIAYEVPKPKSRDFGLVHVTLLLRDRSGNLLRVLRDTDEGPGPQVYQWDGLDGTGHPVMPGTYLVETATGDKSKTTKITVGGGSTPSTQPTTATSTTVPAARRVTISYEVPKPPSGQDKTKVVLLIVDASGSPLRKLIDGEQVPGKHSLSWDGLDDKGTALPSGTYEYELRAGEKMLRKKVELK